MAQSRLELRDVSLSFSGHPVLNNVTLDVRPGESVTLIGPSGQGKTSILKLLAGLIKPTEGQVFVDGEHLAELSPERRDEVRLKMGMLFQRGALFDSLTAFDNIAFPLRETSNLDERAIVARVEDYLEMVGLAHARDLRPDEISGGMQKRLGIARALALEPLILFYDDPTAGLDPITSRSVIDLILELHQRHKTTLVSVTNEMNRAYQIADRIMMVTDGEVIDTGSPAETRAHKDPRVRQFVRGLIEGPLT